MTTCHMQPIREVLTADFSALEVIFWIFHIRTLIFVDRICVASLLMEFFSARNSETMSTQQKNIKSSSQTTIGKQVKGIWQYSGIWMF